MNYWDCPIKEWSAFTEEDLEWFELTPGDTIYFNDNLGNDSVFLTCVSRKQWVDTTCVEEIQCTDEIQCTSYHFINFGFTSSIPHGNDWYLHLDIELKKLSSSFNIEMTFQDESNDYYSFWFMYRSDEHKFYNKVSGAIENVGSININGEDYSDVLAISYSDDGGSYPFVYYDTLYFNKDGFLKFISSQHGYVLERLP
jgi:hypothetical protein